MSMMFVLLLLPLWLESNTQQKDTICKDIFWQQGENPVFLFDKFFKVWDQPYLKKNRQNFYPDDSCAFAFWST
jgi:hypothetical protein